MGPVGNVNEFNSIFISFFDAQVLSLVYMALRDRLLTVVGTACRLISSQKGTKVYIMHWRQ